MVGVATAARLVGGIVLLLSNGFFVTTEFAMTRVRQFPEEEFQSAGLQRAWEMTERLEIYLSGCQLGITVSSVGLGVIAEPAVAAVFAPLLETLGITSGAGHSTLSVLIALAFINLLHVIIGEQAPTYLGIERSKFVARYGAPPLYWWTRIMWPVIKVSDWTAKALLRLFDVDITRSWAEEEAEPEVEPGSRGDLRRTMGETLSQAGLPEERREEVINALEIGELTVEEIMVPREDVVALSTADDWETNLERIRESPHSRFPLVGEDLEDFKGIIYTPMLLRELGHSDGDEVDLEGIATPPMTTSPDTVVSDLIDRFQTENQEIAVVVGDGKAVGMVTATDAFEEITGELQDPLDEQFDLDSEHT